MLGTHLANDFAAAWAKPFFSIGAYGVELFFVLSGWLLGRQLLTELQATGSIRVRRFLARRWLRTLPIYYVLLGVFFARQILSKPDPVIDWRFLVFVQNYDFENLPYFTVSWSLCVEEHFYLAIAPLVLLCRRRGGWLVLAAIVAAPSLFRVLGWYDALAETHVRYDCCLVGVGLAVIAVYWPSMWQALGRWSGVGLFLAAVGFAFECVCRYFTPGPGPLGHLGFAVLSGFLIIVAVQTRWLELFCLRGLARYVATRSYALYLTHQLLMFSLGKRLPEGNPVAAVVAILATSFAVSEVLYRLVERPGMRLRDRLAWSR